MGNCCGKSADSKRRDNWRATGIVSLRDSGLKTLPGAVLEISNDIRILDASNNRLSQLPDSPFGWQQLQRLVLADNALIELPASIASMQQLRHLALDGNSLALLSPQLGQLSRLEQLLLQGNRLGSIPPTIGQLRTLKTINLSRNQLQDLPAELGQCSSLQEIDASQNKLLRLPASLAALKKLKVLQLDKNQIPELPEQLLSGCSSLHTLSLHDNPITPQQLESTPGFEAFNARRRGKYDKGIAGGALLNSNGLDEGVDRLLK